MRQLLVCLLVTLAISFYSQSKLGKCEYIGPKENAKQYKGLIMSVWAENDNPNIVLAGSSNGGLFKTTNALDSIPIWYNITENLPYMNFGVNGIVVKTNTNANEIYIATGSGGGIITKGFGNGVLHTKDGGKSWNRVGPIGKNDYEFVLKGLSVNLDNESEMAAFVDEDLYLTKNNWSNYTKIKLPFHPDLKGTEITQVEFAPYEPNKIYVTTRTYLSNKAQLIVSLDFGNTWKDITPPDVACERIAISTIRNLAFKSKYYITAGNTAIYLKYFNGSNFSTNLNSVPISHLGAQSFWCLDLKVNHLDTSIIYLSLTETSMSKNGGKSFSKIGSYNAPNSHADVRAMCISKATLGGKDDLLLLANDGGVSMTNTRNNDPEFFRNINGIGLNANQFWGIDVLQSNQLFISGGTQDNGGFFMKEKEEYNNLQFCGDGYYSLCINDSIGIVLCNPPNMLWVNMNKKESRFFTIPDPNFEARRPIILKDSFIYIGYHDVWRASIERVIKGNCTFENVSLLPKKVDKLKGVQNREIKAMAISNKNSVLIGYANPNWDSEINEGKLYYCNNIQKKNPNFIDITSISATVKTELCRWAHVECIVSDNNSKNTFYLIYKDVFDQRNSSIYKLVYFPDSHKVQLTEILFNLNKVGLNKLLIDKQTNQLFVATNDGVYAKSLNNSDTVYVNLNFQPKVFVSDLSINYFTNTLYVGTFGRGIWASQIPSIHNQSRIIKKNRLLDEPIKVDGVLTVKRRKSLTINSKLIITPGSKIVLGARSKLIIKDSSDVRDENNLMVDINTFLIQHKKSKVQIVH